MLLIIGAVIFAGVKMVVEHLCFDLLQEVVKGMLSRKVLGGAI